MLKKFLITLAGIIFVTPCFAVCPICIDITDTVCMAQKQACEANEESMRMQEEMLRQQIMQQEQDMLMQQQHTQIPLKARGYAIGYRLGLHSLISKVKKIIIH